jgi:hypothetical protein
MSEESAGRRLWAARKCRDFPALFDALMDGRIHMTAIHTLAPHLSPGNVDELVAAATGRSKAQLLDWLACRFPRTAVPTVIRPMGSRWLRRHRRSRSRPRRVHRRWRAASVGPAHADRQMGNDSHSLASVPVPSSALNPTTSQVPLRDRAHVDP